MKALILAAGLGTRLQPLTNTTPKPLVPIAGKPLLQYHLEQFAEYGIKDILINTHHLPEQINHFVKEWMEKHPDMHIETTFEHELLGSAGTIEVNKKFFENEDTFLIMYGDNFTNINYEKLFARHAETKGLMTIACYVEEKPETKGIADIDEDGRILRFVEKPKPGQIDSKYANAGIYVADKKLFHYLEHEYVKPYDFGHHVFPSLLAKNEELFAYIMTESFIDIGTLESYAKAQSIPNSWR